MKMLSLEIIKQIMEIHSESKAYLNAYEATGDLSLLEIAQGLELDALNLELTYR